jgi:hypothetical protein
VTLYLSLKILIQNICDFLFKKERRNKKIYRRLSFPDIFYRSLSLSLRCRTQIFQLPRIPLPRARGCPQCFSLPQLMALLLPPPMAERPPVPSLSPSYAGAQAPSPSIRVAPALRCPLSPLSHTQLPPLRPGVPGTSRHAPSPYLALVLLVCLPNPGGSFLCMLVAGGSPSHELALSHGTDRPHLSFRACPIS